MTEITGTASAGMFPDVTKYVEARVTEFSEISDERKKSLEELSLYIRNCLVAQKPARLTFVCTHNSRRSHFAQIWAQVAASHYGIADVESFSGGTEATAFNPRSIAALQRAGLQVQLMAASEKNPRYAVRFQDEGDPTIGFSKVFNESPNPSQGFCAVMTCSQADKSCPIVPGCDLRIAIPYEDPKVSDMTPLERSAYDERSAQIAREMLYVMSRVKP